MHSLAGFGSGAHMQPRSVQFKWGFVRSTVTESQQPAWAGKPRLRLEEGRVVLAWHDARKQSPALDRLLTSGVMIDLTKTRLPHLEWMPHNHRTNQAWMFHHCRVTPARRSAH